MGSTYGEGPRNWLRLIVSVKIEGLGDLADELDAKCIFE